MDDTQSQTEKSELYRMGMRWSKFELLPGGDIMGTVRLGDDSEKVILTPAEILEGLDSRSASVALREKLSVAIKALKDRAGVTA